MPVHTPALKMPCTSSQLMSVLESKATSASGKYLFAIIGFSLPLITKQFPNGFLAVYLPFTFKSSTSKIKVLYGGMSAPAPRSP